MRLPWLTLGVLAFIATATAQQEFVTPTNTPVPFVSPGDLTPDLAGDPIPAAPPVADEAPAPLDATKDAPPADSGLEKAKPPRRAGAAAPPPPAAAAAPAAKPAAKPATAKPAAPAPATAPPPPPPAKPTLPAADLTYAITARRATVDPAGAKLTLEGVTPIVAGVRTFDSSTRAGRRQTAARFLSGDFERNGTWLNSPAAILFGTLDATRSGGGKSEVALPLRLYAVSYSTASGNAAFRALQLDGPANATISGGVSNYLLDQAADAGASLKAVKRVTLQDPLLLVDAVFARKDEYKGPEGFGGAKGA